MLVTQLYLFRNLWVSGIFWMFSTTLTAQNTPADSLRFTSVQQELSGCWRCSGHQFKYNAERNSGGDFKSSTHSSAPVFFLSMKDGHIYMEWVEVTGGSDLVEIIHMTKNKLEVKYGSGDCYFYRRNKTCS